MARVDITPDARMQLAELPVPIGVRVHGVIDRLKDWPRVSGAKALRGNLKGNFRIRTGDYRLIFSYAKAVDTVTVWKMDIGATFTTDRRSHMHKMNTIVIDKKRYVLVPEAKYKSLVAEAASLAPPLPPKLPNGNYPALQAVKATIAQSIVRDRLSVGLSQKELAQAAGIRVEVLNRAERGVNVPSLKTAIKIENALARFGVKRNRIPK